VALVMARRGAHSLLPLALSCAIGLPLMAFYQGHPFRVRYLVPMIVAAAGACRMGHRYPAKTGAGRCCRAARGRRLVVTATAGSRRAHGH
jgi:hypothetical protein